MFSNFSRGSSTIVALRTILFIALVAASFAAPTAFLGCSDDSSTPPPDPVGSVRGVVIEPQSGQPIEGASVTIDPVAAKKSATTTTDADGEFWFLDVKPGLYNLSIDASAIVVDPGNLDLVYLGSTVIIEVVAGRETSSDFFAPVVDTSEETPVVPGRPTVVEPASIPGLRIDIPADAVTFPPGSGSTINVVELGFDQGPSPLPPGFAPVLTIKILPEGTLFDPPATITWPNRAEMTSAHPFEQYSHDGSGWAPDGGATANASAVEPDTGTDVGAASTHFIVCAETIATGSLVDQFQAPISGAEITLHASVYPFEQQEWVPLESAGGMTDAAGNFAIGGVHACRLFFSAEYSSAEAFGQLNETSSVMASSGGNTDLGDYTMELTTQTRYFVSGTVRRADGSPAAGVDMSWFEPGPGKGFGAITDEFGDYTMEIQHDPGATIRVSAWDGDTGASGDVETMVPPLTQSGSTVSLPDIYICNQDDFDSCGEWGSWQLNGNILALTLNRLVCGQVETEEMPIQLNSLVDGTLSFQFEDNGQTVDAMMTRVQGFGPSGITAGNLPGVYAAEADSVVSLVVGFYADGTMNAWSAGDTSLQSQWGTYTADSDSLYVDFLFSNEIEGGPQPGQSMTVAWSREGDTLTIVDPQEPSVFNACPNGPDDGAVENAWVNANGNFTLLIYDGEFATVAPMQPAPGKMFR